MSLHNAHALDRAQSLDSAQTSTSNAFSSLEVIDTVATFAEPEGTRWGVYQSGGSDGPIAALSQRIEQAVFHDEYGLPPAEMDEEFSPFNDRTVWHLVVNHETMQPVASARHLVGPARRFKAVDDLSDYWSIGWDDAAAAAGFDPDGQFLEACTYSVLPNWRTADRGWPTKMAMALQSHAMAELSAQASVQVINPRVLRVFKMWRAPFVPIADAVDIKGAPFQPVFCPHIDRTPWMRSSDTEFVDLFVNRGSGGRGGTRLDPIDLNRLTTVQAHNAAVFAAERVPLPI